MADTVWSMLTAILIIAIVYMLVRPGSPAGAAVKDIGSALQDLVSTAVSGPAPANSSTPNQTA